MNDNRDASTAALALRVTEMRQQYAAEVYHQLKGWVGRDASRELAAMALATWSRRHVLDEQTTSRVLSFFEPERELKPGVDYRCVNGCTEENANAACKWHGAEASVDADQAEVDK